MVPIPLENKKTRRLGIHRETKIIFLTTSNHYFTYATAIPS